MDVLCIRCGEAAGVTVDIEDGDKLHCPGCDADYTLADVEETIAGWQAILPWLKSHPARIEEAVAAAK
jgi:hypothetical protein